MCGSLLGGSLLGGSEDGVLMLLACRVGLMIWVAGDVAVLVMTRLMMFLGMLLLLLMLLARRKLLMMLVAFKRLVEAQLSFAVAQLDAGGVGSSILDVFCRLLVVLLEAVVVLDVAADEGVLIFVRGTNDCASPTAAGRRGDVPPVEVAREGSWPARSVRASSLVL